MHYSMSVEDAMNKILKFYDFFCEKIDFINYFKDKWEPQLSKYVPTWLFSIVGDLVEVIFYANMCEMLQLCVSNHSRT